MSVKTAKLQFNGGELSPWLAGRLDIAKYNQTAKLCRNFLPLTEGSLKRRGGTRFVAKTPDTTNITFAIVAVPVDAKIIINDCLQSTLKVALGDTVHYEVSAHGYVTTRGKYVVTENTTLEINLVSLSTRKTLTISATPSDAVVKIAGYPRTVYQGCLNETVQYIVYKNGYKMVVNTAVLDNSKTVSVSLTAHSEDEGSYGTWGTPQAFICCSAYGALYPQKKCFLIHFTNGYLPILFDAYKTAPDDKDVDESLFISTPSDGYNGLCVNAINQKWLAVIRRGKEAVFYNNLDGTVINGFMTKNTGWQVDENGDFASIYNTYDGYVVGKTVKVCYKGNLVWSMKGRSNG